MSKKKEGKITLGMLKGKPVTTSVPSIAIKFHANAEQLEELYPASDEEHSAVNDTGAASTTTVASESESSPLKYLPRLVKRSTSIDITPSSKTKKETESSPPSDPWRFFSDIKGKITKSVEDKITEIKARNQEEGSPLKKNVVKDSKDNSSVSDSEDLSESSISKTCGIVSTTEGAEMSSDDDTPSIEKDKKFDDTSKPAPSIGGGLRQRFRLLKSKHSAPSKEGTVPTRGLAKLYNINTERIEQALPEHTEEIESGVDALEDTNLNSATGRSDSEEKVLKSVAGKYDNIAVDKDNVVNVRIVRGHELKTMAPSWSREEKTVFAPVGFVDMRPKMAAKEKNFQFYMPLGILFVLLVLYTLIQMFSRFLAGFIAGIAATYLYFWVKSINEPLKGPLAYPVPTKQIYEIPAVREHQPLNKYEGWVNEFPETYNPHTYHISQTQSVYLRLQGNLLRLSHTKAKIPKRALWNEPKLKPAFTHHRIYNLQGAKVALLPEGLAKKRHWSKKYPICVTLSKSQMDLDPDNFAAKLEEEEEEKAETPKSVEKIHKKGFGFRKKKYAVVTQRFSKLTEEEEEYELDSDNSRASTPSPSPDFSDDPALTNEHVQRMSEVLNEDLERFDIASEYPGDEFDDNILDEWATFTADESPTETKLYLFGRTDREKEDWFRRLISATHKGANAPLPSSMETEASISDTLIDGFFQEEDYVKFMLLFNKTSKRKKKEKHGKQDKNDKPDKQESNDKTEASSRFYVDPQETASTASLGSDASATSSNLEEESPSLDLIWLNALLGRIMYDLLHDPKCTVKIKERIERKLAAIKLPYFIEELSITELSLGNAPVFIHRASKPVLDERGMWIDLDMTYEGLVVLTLHTQLNLMKLKHPPTIDKGPAERHAMFNSDVDDSAESSSDDDDAHLFQYPSALDDKGLPVRGLGGTSTTSKKFVKMVDRIAESKFFQAASENRYIKKAMEGVSNTDLRLKVEIRELVGTLVLNIPAPPSDRLWVSFRPVPDLVLTAHPIVGERNITMMRISNWIEKKMLQEFQKLLVIPNMEDITIPGMDPRLPE